MNSENLIPNSARTPEERKRLATKAGIASGKARQEKKMIQQALRRALDGTYAIGDKENKETLGGYDAMAIAMIKQAIQGNVKAFVAVRDSIGEKEPEKVSFIDTENQKLAKEYLEAIKNGRTQKTIRED